MEGLIVHSQPEVEEKFNSYPEEIKVKLKALRALIIETAAETESIQEMEETLKWGEPSYLVKKGSTIRIDWKEKHPDFYAMYFKCTSKLVPTFKTLFGDLFTYENTRALRFELDADLPISALKTCIRLALRYHWIKNEPLLGEGNKWRRKH
ncbi:MAG: DUF1801 domain-containing protein [Bacteroidota bacterium]